VLAFALAVILLASLTLPSAVALASNQASADSQIVIPPTSGGEIFFPTGPDVGAVVVPQSGPPLAPVGVNGAGTCSGPNLIANGDFEGGFSGDGIGNSWTAFNDGGRASYGYFDDTWPQVVVNGFNAQLIQINTYNMGAADGNRFSGIFQVIDGLVPGATYELSMYGEMREEAAHSNEDPYRYRVQWGYAPARPDSSVADIWNWSELPWNSIYLESSGGPMLPFSVQFQAPSHRVMIGIRALKKWGTTMRELDVDLDAIHLVPCGGSTPALASVEPPVVSVAPASVVPPVVGFAPASGFVDDQAPQVTDNPVAPVADDSACPFGGCSGYTPASVGNNYCWQAGGCYSDPAPVQTRWYVVRRGDSLSRIAARYGVSVLALMRRNGLRDANFIYWGERLVVDW
jgi:hypothetical protein